MLVEELDWNVRVLNKEITKASEIMAEQEDKIKEQTSLISSLQKKNSRSHQCPSR